MGAIIRLDQRHARAYVAEPEQRPRARVLVVHDSYGLLPHVRFLCDELAAVGMVALAPDLFDGTSTRSDAQASRLLERLTPDRALGLLRSALRAYDTLGHGLGADAAIGFSIGAEFATALGADGTVDALVSYYGMPPPEHRTALTAALLVHWAEHDAWDDDEATPRSVVAELGAAGVDVESYVYPGTRHGFANADLDAFDLDAAELAWSRSVAFLADRLQVS